MLCGYRVEDGMDWTDCPAIEVVPGRMSGAPVLRGTRVRPQDLLINLDQSPAWMADAFRLRIEDVQAVLAFYEAHRNELPAEYLSAEWILAEGANIDWSRCTLIEARPDRLSGVPAIKGTTVRPEALVLNRDAGEGTLAETYRLPPDTVHAVLSYYDQRKRHLAPAV
jgi:uncharacterized protein (DUF433 family)